MAPNNADMVEQTASVAEMLGYKKAVLLYAQDDYNRELAFLFEDAAIDRGMVFVHRHSVSGQETDYRGLITEFANKPIDMVFLATGAEAGARIVRQLREMGVPVPVMGSDALAKRTFVETVGSLGDNTITPMIYHAEAETFINRRFREDYRNEFGEEPDQDAAQGYDSLGLMAAGIEQAHSTLPSLVASTLHYLSFWTGVTGVHAFDSRGEILGKNIFSRSCGTASGCSCRRYTCLFFSRNSTARPVPDWAPRPRWRPSVSGLPKISRWMISASCNWIFCTKSSSFAGWV